jgi:hypothetical protein
MVISKSISSRLGLKNNERRFVIIENIKSGEIKKFLTSVKAAKYLDCSRITLSSYIKKEKIYKNYFKIYFKIETIN